MPDPKLAKKVRIEIGTTTLDVVELVNLEASHEGGIESKYGQTVSGARVTPWNRHKIGMQKVLFTIRRMYKTGVSDNLLYDLHQNDTIFNLKEYVKDIYGEFCGLEIINCASYRYNSVTGTPNDIVIEEVQGEGLTYSAVYTTEEEYIKWDLLWAKNFISDWGVIIDIASCELSVFADLNKVTFLDGYVPQLIDVQLDDGGLNSLMQGIVVANGYSYYRQQTSIYKKYFVYIYKSGVNAILRIYKNGEVVETKNLTALFGWAYDYWRLGCSITQDGKYIAVWNNKAGAYQGEIKFYEGA